MRGKIFIVYTWLTVVAWYGLIYLISNTSYIDLDGSYSKALLNSLGYELLYAFQFLLIFRALLITLKLKVDRLNFWRSWREHSEDGEFTKIIEILIAAISVLATLNLAIIDEYHQTKVLGRVGSAEDVLVDLVGILFSTVLVFILPILSEIEARWAKVALPKKH